MSAAPLPSPVPALHEKVAAPDPDLSGDPRTIAIIGAGPVGHRVVSELLARDDSRPIAIFGSEQWEPYNRVRLSSLMVGDVALPELYTPLTTERMQPLSRHFNCPVVAIDRVTRTLMTGDGRLHRWSQIVIATGSNPHVPEIDGIHRDGVYTFRNLDDAHRLAARRASARRVVVLGGGLLGLEVARGMQRHHTEVTIIDHASHLMSRQLDAQTAEELRARVLATGIRVITGVGVREVLGEAAVDGVRLLNGRRIECDTLIVATGIRPNVNLARRAGLSCGRGIRVNPRMQTSDPDIYAAGECVEFNGEVYGLVAPGLAQAAVVAANLLGKGPRYTHEAGATRLKVFGTTVFSMGETQDPRPLSNLRSHGHRDSDSGDEARVFTRRGRIVGASAIGSKADLGELQEKVSARAVLWPWQLQRFLRTGRLRTKPRGEDVAAWPASAPVCNCMGVNRGQVTRAVHSGCTTVAEVSACTGAGTVCGSCTPLIGQLLGGAIEPERGAGILVGAGRLSLLMALVVLLPVAVPYLATATAEIAWDVLWRDGLAKQVTGYTLMVSALLLSVISLRKRIQRFRFMEYANWRLLHVLLGLFALGALTAHTGLRAGHALNAFLMTTFVGVVVGGACAGWLIGVRHRSDATWTRDAINASLWLHILCLWPLPVLLGFHVLKIYWF